MAPWRFEHGTFGFQLVEAKMKKCAVQSCMYEMGRIGKKISLAFCRDVHIRFLSETGGATWKDNCTLPQTQYLGNFSRKGSEGNIYQHTTKNNR